jgi:hypothetical protein
VRIWDVESGVCLAIAEGHMAAVGAVAFSKKSRKFLVTGSRWAFKLFMDMVFTHFYTIYMLHIRILCRHSSFLLELSALCQ